MSKIIWKKEYERDVTLVLEGIWARGLEEVLLERLNTKTKNSPFIVFYADEENVQIWENAAALQEFRDIVLKENKKSPDFMNKVVGEYNKNLDKIKKFWTLKSITGKKELARYIELVSKTVNLFSLWYYAGIDERTPPNIAKMLIELRSTDEFFAQNNIFIKSCLVSLGVKRELANLVFPEEFPDVPPEKVLRERAKGTISIDGKTKRIVSLKDFAKENPNYEFEGLNISVSSIKEIKGQIGFKGVVQGKVRIVKNYKQAEEIKEGEIIVSPMTTPDFLQAMKKASAFITNEGGITCHAAIVAREMKKPCIIGTKIATQVLKDGDLVEVDANNGVVRKI